MGSFCSCDGPAVVYHRRPVNTPGRRPFPPAYPQSTPLFPHTGQHHEGGSHLPPRDRTISTLRSPRPNVLPSEHQTTASRGLWAPLTAGGPIDESSPRAALDAASKTSDDQPVRRPRLTRLILDEDAEQPTVAVEADPFSQLRSASTFDEVTASNGNVELDALRNASNGNVELDALRNASNGLLTRRSSSSESSSSPYLIQRQHTSPYNGGTSSALIPSSVLS